MYAHMYTGDHRRAPWVDAWQTPPSVPGQRISPGSLQLKCPGKACKHARTTYIALTVHITMTIYHYIHTLIYIYIYIYIYYMYIYIYFYTWLSLYIYLSLYISLSIYISLYIYISIYTRLYIRRLRRSSSAATRRTWSWNDLPRIR